MGKFLGTAGLSRLWNKFKNNLYVLKTDENSGSTPDTTYPYSPTSVSNVAITVNIYVAHSGSSSTLSCTLSQPVNLNLLFRLWNSTSNTSRWFTVLAGNTTISITEPDSALNNTSGRLDNMNSAEIVELSELQSHGYTFTVNIHNNSAYEHVIYVSNAQVDWHAKTVSGTLTRSTTDATNPAISSRVGVVGYYDSECYKTTGSFTIPANSNSVSITNAPITEEEFSLPIIYSNYSIMPVNYQFTTTQSNRYITSHDTEYTPLAHNITISVSSWAHTNICPEIIYYRSSNSSVYSGTLPGIHLSIGNTVSGDCIQITLTVYWRENYYNNLPYSTFSQTWNYGYAQNIYYQTSNNYFWENVPDYQQSNKVYFFLDAYLYMGSGSGFKYIGYWPSSNTTGNTGSFTMTSTKPDTASRPKSTNTAVFGTITLNRKFW